MKYLKVTTGDGVSRRARGPAGAAGRGGEGAGDAEGAGSGRSTGSGGNAGGSGDAEGARVGGDAGSGRSAGSGGNAGGSGDARGVGTERAPHGAPHGAPLGAPLNDYDILAPACPSRTVLRHVVDRWTPLVVAVLARGPHRFGELRAAVGGITPKVLTETLRSMERDGLVTRDNLTDRKSVV